MNSLTGALFLMEKSKDTGLWYLMGPSPSGKMTVPYAVSTNKTILTTHSKKLLGLEQFGKL